MSRLMLQITLPIVVLVNLTGYMVNPTLGFATTMVTVLFVFVRARGSQFEKLLTLLIMTMPLYGLPMFSGIHHAFSWTTLLLLALSVYAAAHMQRVAPAVCVPLVVIAALTVATHIFNGSGTEGIYYIAQVLLFVLPASIVYLSRDWIVTVVGSHAIPRLLNTLAATLMACGLGVFLQVIVHRTTEVTIGSVSFFANRISYDLTLNAFSVLSVILAIGFVIVPVLIRRGSWLQGLALAAVSGGAILLNTSRSGLFVGLLVLLVSLLFPAGGGKQMLLRLVFFPAAIFAYWLYALYSGSGRGVQDFFDDNGRFETFAHALTTLATNPITLFFGAGYNSSAYAAMSPHNFLIESLLRSGLIVFLAVFILIAGLLRYLWRTEWQYPVWVLLAGGMLFAGFYAVKAAVVVAIVMLVLRAADSARLQGTRHALAPVRPSGDHLNRRLGRSTGTSISSLPTVDPAAEA